MIGNLFKAVGQLGDPRIRGILAISLLATLAVFGVIFMVVIVTLGAVKLSGGGWLDGVVQWLGGIGVVIFAFFTFPAFMGVVASFFLERVADAVEDRHYPNLPEAPGLGTAASVAVALKFAGLVLLANLLALPFYILFIWFPLLSYLLFVALNGYLLGREYFELVGLRRLDPRAAKKLRKANGTALFGAGAAIAVLTTIPVVNLLTPILATAFMTHVFHGLRPPGETGDRRA